VGHEEEDFNMLRYEDGGEIPNIDDYLKKWNN
jgi:hypothetical protein